MTGNPFQCRENNRLVRCMASTYLEEENLKRVKCMQITVIMRINSPRHRTVDVRKAGNDPRGRQWSQRVTSPPVRRMSVYRVTHGRKDLSQRRPFFTPSAWLRDEPIRSPLGRLKRLGNGIFGSKNNSAGS